MLNQEIQQDQWGSFLDNFTREHLGQPVTIQVLAGTQGPHTVAGDLPLVGVVCDPKNSAGRIIEIIAGDSPESNVVHEISRPSHVRVAKADDGRANALEIESEDEPKTILHFGGPQVAAQVAG